MSKRAENRMKRALAVTDEELARHIKEVKEMAANENPINFEEHTCFWMKLL